MAPTYLTFVSSVSFLTFLTCVTLTDVTDSPISASAARGKLARIATGVLLALVALLLTVVVAAPIALSSGDLVRWAAAPTGLGLTDWWPWLVFLALDAAAGVCVLLAVYCAFTGQSACIFKILVWVFAGASALANYRHNIVPGSPTDGWWFFPASSVLGPGLLEAVTWFVRRQVERRRGVRAGGRPKFGLGRWLPIIGSPRDTYGSYRTAQILGIATVVEAVTTYHQLCPDGSLRVVRAIRARDVAVARTAAEEAAKAARAAARSGGVTVDQVTNGHQTGLRAVAATSRPSAATLRAAVATRHQTGGETGPVEHRPQAVRDAAVIRDRWPDGLPEQGAHAMVKKTLAWAQQKTTDALRAYRANADLAQVSAPRGADDE
jgi:hypothetical protein